MSISSVVRVFETGVNAPPRNAIDGLIQRQLEAAAIEVAAVKVEPSDGIRTPITDIGEYLIQAAQVWTSLTNNLVKGSHVEAAIIEAHERSRIQTKSTDLSTATAMDVEISKLRKIRDLTAQFCRDAQDVWLSGSPVTAVEPPCQQIAFSPFRESKRSSLTRPSTSTVDVDVKAHSSQVVSSTSELPPSQLSPISNASGGDESEDEDELFAQIDLESLKQRGKGSHQCPLGQRCDKGGVDKEGNVVVFDRNSSFAQHCNKHRKPWRCDIPGCPNPPKKRKFARRDGLERHKATVKHGIVK